MIKIEDYKKKVVLDNVTNQIALDKIKIKTDFYFILPNQLLRIHKERES